MLSCRSPSARVRRAAVAGGTAKTAVSAAFCFDTFTKRQPPQATTPPRSSCSEHSWLRANIDVVVHIARRGFDSSSSHDANRFLPTGTGHVSYQHVQ